MYYIINQNHQIIAIDNALLALLTVENIDELYRKIALGDIDFSSLDKEVIITTPEAKRSFHAETELLTGMLGNITLVQIQLAKNDHTKEEKIVPLNDTPLPIDNMDYFLKENEAQSDSNTLHDLSPLDDESISFSDLDELNERDEKISLLEEMSIETEVQDDDLFFDLTLPSTQEEKLDDPFSFKSENEEVPTKKKESTSIVIDVEQISKEIGISTEDYNNFLNEYIDTALTLEEDIKSDNHEKSSHAITTLSHLSTVLHIPVITDIIINIQNGDTGNKKMYVKSLYDTLTKLTTTEISTHIESPAKEPQIVLEKKAIEKRPVEEVAIIKKESLIEDDIIPLIDIKKVPVAPKINTITKTSAKKGFGTIDLSNVKPIHFDFRLQDAADRLDLPTNLIEEFIDDFIEQAQTETEKMLKAYEEGDIDTIQKIGHLLKGISSNLYIIPLSETLYNIQLCNNSNNLEHLIKEYWGHYLSFKTQIDLSTKS